MAISTLGFFLLYLLVILSAAFFGGALFKKFGQPPVIGYLLAGTVLGILFGTSYTHEVVELLSELGIVLLLFTLGLEFSFHKLSQMVKVALIGGVIQIIITIWLQSLLMLWLGFDLVSSLFASAAFSLSSTAVVIKILSDRGELDSLPGEIMVTWLIIQDLAVLPMFVFLPVIVKIAQGATHVSEPTNIARLVFVTSLVLVVFIGLGKKLIPWFIGRVANLNNRELLLVSVFTIAVAGALFTQLIGLSAALGAFLAGLLIAESSQQHAVFSEIRPLRDLFALLFFATLGLVLPAGFLFAHFPMILILTLSVIVVKFLVVGLLTAYLGYHPKTVFTVGLGLIEVGEFAFILARVGLNDKIISQDIYGYILSVALLSILIAPPLFLAAPVLYKKLREVSKTKLAPLYLTFFTPFEYGTTIEQLPFANHVVLCGYGRVGKYIGKALQLSRIPFVVVEYNHHKTSALRAAGLNVVYGDPADYDILDYAQVDKAKALVIAIPDLHTQQEVISNSLKLNQDILIYCRSHHEEHQKHLKNLGVTAVVQPEFEAALSITDKILTRFGANKRDIEMKLTQLKVEHGLG